ncbi:MAG: hypothetical protein KDA77_17800, partial [Planctomycetaceae bacterium]|nr:hypothetical protein [Planctomycetaceae bacterium]
MSGMLNPGVTVEIVDQPAQGGTVTINPDNGKVNFVSNGSTYVGLDHFTYRVKDALGAYSEIATVDFSIAPDGVILVTTLSDNTSADNNRVSLREAILAANADASVDAAPAGNGSDTIMFDPILFMNEGSSDLVARVMAQQATQFAITDSVTIIAPVSANGDPLLTIDATPASGSSRHFFISDGTATVLQVNLQNLILIEGKTSDNGGSIFNSEHLVLTYCHLLNSQTTSGLGGAIYNTGTLELVNSLLQTNQSLLSSGGAIASVSGSVSLNQTTIDDSDSEGFGGGLYAVNTDLSIINSVISNNSSFLGGGGGIYQNLGMLTITGSSIFSNTTGSASDGGGVYATETTTSITDSTFHINRSSGSGGGLSQNSGTLSVRNSTFSENEALFGNGGGIYTGANTVTVVNSTISGNTASQNGGGIYFVDHVYFASGTIDNSTIAANHADMNGGGLHFENIFEKVAANNTIIADNTAAGSGADGFGALLGSYSIIEDTNGLDLLSAVNFITGQDPGLLPLGDYGGLTQTHALAANSIAIDAGDPTFNSNSFTPALT